LRIWIQIVRISIRNDSFIDYSCQRHSAFLRSWWMAPYLPSFRRRQGLRLSSSGQLRD
jgi:hypothetical protein